jgi:hypothetical protein
MPMLTPNVWCLHAPDYVTHIAEPDIACQLVMDGKPVCLPSFETARDTLILLGAEPNHANHLMEVARLQPPSQETYLA